MKYSIKKYLALIPALLISSSIAYADDTTLTEGNGEDICYAEPYTESIPGRMSFCMGFGGINCRNIIPIVNSSGEELTDVDVYLTSNGTMNASFQDNCGVLDDEGTCQENSNNILAGQLQIFGYDYQYTLDDMIADDDRGTYTEDAVSINFNNDILYASYTKDGVAYYSKVNPCDPAAGYTTAQTGPFDAWDTDSDITHRIIQTEVVSTDFSLIINSLNAANNATEAKEGIDIEYRLYDFGTLKGITDWESYNASSSADGASEEKLFSDITKAYKNVRVQFKYCLDNAGLHSLSYCSDHNIDTNTSTFSTDNFAIRPNKFDLAIPATNAVKAEDVNLTCYAYDGDGNATINYNESANNLDFATAIADASKSCANTSLDIASSDDFTNGVDEYSVTLATVGIWNVQISEKSGHEFALVDLDDTSDSRRYITPSDNNITIIPSYFSVSVKDNINNDGNFTYLANDLDHMGINFDMNVTAKNSAGDTTQNYADSCYADDTNLDLAYTIVSPASFADKVIYKELTSGVDGNNTASDNNLSLASLPKSLFGNGEAEMALRINFQRDKSVSLNPFKVNINDINISDQLYTPVVTSTDASHSIDKNATMIYGRTHAPRQRFTGDTGDALIYYEAYCYGSDASGTNCDKTLLPDGSDSKSTDDPRWFTNTKHTSIDGNVGTPTQKNGDADVTTNSVSTDSPADASLTYNSASTKGYPFKTTMQNDASSWLIYNKYKSTATTNEFEVEFTNDNSTWAGQHETNTTTIRNSSFKTNRRTMW